MFCRSLLPVEPIASLKEATHPQTHSGAEDTYIAISETMQKLCSIPPLAHPPLKQKRYKLDIHIPYHLYNVTRYVA